MPGLIDRANFVVSHRDVIYRSQSANATKLKRLALDFRHLRQEDVNKALPERHGTSLVLAMRRQEPPAFAEFRRPGTEKIFPS